MGAKQTRWEDLGISNDFLFGKVMQNPDLCKELLQRILPDLKIDHVEYPELQKTIKPDADAKSIRLDVYIKDNKNVVYNIDYSDFRFIPINLFKGCIFKPLEQIYRNNSFSILA